ncbi:unnamed protein product [Victoria cruziana]
MVVALLLDIYHPSYSISS